MPTLTGTIEASDSTLLEGVTITFESQSHPATNSNRVTSASKVQVTTDANGAFSGLTLRPGDYKVTYYHAVDTGPVKTEFTIRVPSDSNTYAMDALVITAYA